MKPLAWLISALVKRSSTPPVDVRTAFMDGTSFLFELGSDRAGHTIYTSAKQVKTESRHNLAECGVAEVEVRFVRWAQKPRMRKMRGKKR